MAKRILIYANCQGLVVAKAVRAHPDLATTDIRIVENYKDDPAVQEVAASCDLVLAQMVHGEKFRRRFAAIVSALPPDARTVRFPAMHASHLWPQFFQDYTVKPEPGYKHGRFPWGDKLLINLVRQGGSKAAILEQYLTANLAEKFDLRGLYRLALGGMQQLETECDVAISDIYAQNIFERQTFFSPYHAANYIVNAISNRMFAALGLRTLQEDELPQGNLLRDAELPIHRSVAAFFGVKFIHPDTTYLSRAGTQVSEHELCSEYIDWLLQRQAQAAQPATVTA